MLGEGETWISEAFLQIKIPFASQGPGDRVYRVHEANIGRPQLGKRPARLISRSEGRRGRERRVVQGEVGPEGVDVGKAQLGIAPNLTKPQVHRKLAAALVQTRDALQNLTLFTSALSL